MRIYIKLIIIFLALTLIPILFVGRITFYNAKNSLEHEILSKIESITNEEVEQATAFFTERKADVIALGHRDIFKTIFSVLDQFSLDPSNPSYAQAKKALDERLAVIQKAYRYVDIMLANKDGKVIYVLNPAHAKELNQVILDKEGIVEKTKDGIYIGNIRKTGHPGHPITIYLAGLVYDEAGKSVGFVAVEANMGFVYELINDNLALGESWETLLIGKIADNKVMFLSPLKYDPKAILNKTITLGSSEAIPAQKVALGESGSGIMIDYRGKKVLSAWRPMPLLGWGLVTKLDVEEAFLPVNKLQRLLTVVFLVTFFSIILTVLAVAKSISEPIHQLHQGTEIIAQGNLDHKVGMKTKDEIGQLSRAFDDMTLSLKQSTTSVENLNKEIAERAKAEKKVEEQAKELERSLREALKAREVLISMLDDNNDIREKLEKHIVELGNAQKMLIQSEKLASLGKLIAEIAHEVNNPLMIISGNAQISLMQKSVSDDVKKNLNIVIEECQRAKTIIQRLLKFSKPSKGEVRLVDINKSLEAVLGISEHFLKLSNVEIKREYQDALPLVPMDEQLIQEVFMNLMNNAKDAMAQGGVMTIATSLEGERVRIDFKDTGSGMPEEVKQKIYEPFFTTKEKGTGLGLLICYGIVKAHNGELRFESQVNQGTTVTILLPLGG